MSAQPQLLPLAAGTQEVPGPLSVIQAAASWLRSSTPPGLSALERSLLENVDLPPVDSTHRGDSVASWLRDDAVTQGLAKARSVEERRALGQFFTPEPIVDVMIDWVKRQGVEQVVDAGCGTGRFAIAAARAMPAVPVLALDSDPLATLVCRARIRELDLRTVTVRCADFLREPLAPPLADARTAFVGNPPYVRHHRLSPELKSWAARASRELGVKFSKLAGLHAYFFLATALHARAGDVGCYVTSAEWLDVNYGSLVRELLAGPLGVQSVSLLEDSQTAFDDAMTSAAITCFRVGEAPKTVSLSVVNCFDDAEGTNHARHVSAAHLGGRWGPLFRADAAPASTNGTVRLGELVSVHRGVATGGNQFFVMSWSEAAFRSLSSFAKPVVSAGKQVLGCGGALAADGLDCIILLPRELDGLCPSDRQAAERYLADGRAAGVADRYLCRHRNPWWWLGPLKPAPIVASYMARRPPAFALNQDGALLLNIAHGLFPRVPMTADQTRMLVDYLNQAAGSFSGNGRTYQGGLEKFEPREMENLRVPVPKELHDLVPSVE